MPTGIYTTYYGDDAEFLAKVQRGQGFPVDWQDNPKSPKCVVYTNSLGQTKFIELEQPARLTHVGGIDMHMPGLPDVTFIKGEDLTRPELVTYSQR